MCSALTIQKEQIIFIEQIDLNEHLGFANNSLLKSKFYQSLS